MTEGPITQSNAVVFLRTRHITAAGRDHDSEKRDIARQRAYCHSAAERLRFTIVKEYVEYGGTGSVASRPVVRHMLSDLRGLLGVRYVLAFSLDRLARKPEHLRELEQQVQAAGAELLQASGLQVSAYFYNQSEAEC